jgi:uncharacterized damage-inducible protein DinB
MDTSTNDIVGTWRINNRVNLYLLDALSPEALTSLLPSARTRTVARMFAHIHQVRLSRIEPAAPTLLDRVEKFAKSDQALDKLRIRRALEQSGEAMAQFIELGVERGKIKGFQLPPIGFLGYLISHEAYHRGEICVALTESGHKLDDAILYGQWEWSKR